MLKSFIPKENYKDSSRQEGQVNYYRFYRLIDVGGDILGFFNELAVLTNSEFIGLTEGAGTGSNQIFTTGAMLNAASYIKELGICIKYNPDNFVLSPDNQLTKYSNLLDFIKSFGEENYDLLPHLQEISEQDYLQHVDNCIQYKLNQV